MGDTKRKRDQTNILCHLEVSGRKDTRSRLQIAGNRIQRNRIQQSRILWKHNLEVTWLLIFGADEEWVIVDIDWVCESQDYWKNMNHRIMQTKNDEVKYSQKNNLAGLDSKKKKEIALIFSYVNRKYKKMSGRKYDTSEQFCWRISYKRKWAKQNENTLRIHMIMSEY